MEDKNSQNNTQTNLTKAFCVSLSADHKTSKVAGTGLNNFQRIILDSALSWVNCTVRDINQGVTEIACALGFSTSFVSTLLSSLNSSLSAYEDMETEFGIVLPAIRVSNLNVEIDPLIILMQKKVIVTIHSEKITRLEKFSRYAEIFMRKMPSDASSNDRITILLTRIIEESNERNFEGLRTIEEQGDEIGKFLLDPKTSRTQLATEIYRMKHALISYLNVLWGTRDVLYSIRYGDAEIITDDTRLLQKISIVENDVTNQISLSEHMSEVLASGLEVLQSIYNNQLQILNNRLSFVMVWLTILGTAVLVPNTLATVMSNSAYAMGPDDMWWYTAIIIISTIVSTWLAYFIVKKWGMFPPKVE